VGDLDVRGRAGDGLPYRPAVPAAPVCATNAKRTFSWRATLPAGTHTLKVYAADAAGNLQSKVGSAKLTIK
jgi:hypothetical protein